MSSASTLGDELVRLGVAIAVAYGDVGAEERDRLLPLAAEPAQGLGPREQEARGGGTALGLGELVVGAGRSRPARTAWRRCRRRSCPVARVRLEVARRLGRLELLDVLGRVLRAASSIARVEVLLVELDGLLGAGRRARRSALGSREQDARPRAELVGARATRSYAMPYSPMRDARRRPSGLVPRAARTWAPTCGARPRPDELGDRRVAFVALQLRRRRAPRPDTAHLRPGADCLRRRRHAFHLGLQLGEGRAARPGMVRIVTTPTHPLRRSPG